MGTPTPALDVDRPQVISPVVQADPVPAGPPSDTVAEVETDDAFLDEEPFPEEPFEAMRRPRLMGTGKGHGRRLVKPAESPQSPMTPEQRLLILDTWQRSGLPAGDFASLVGVSKHTLYAWKKKFEELGPAGLMEQPRGGPKGSRMHRVDQTDGSHAQTGKSRVGLSADQRHAASRAGATGLCGGRGTGTA